MQRIIVPWEYRHVRAFGVARVAGGFIASAAGVICLAYAAHGWAAFFMVLAALSLACGCWYITISRSQRTRA